MSVGLVVFKPDPLSFGHPLCERARFLTEILNGLIRVLRFRCVNADEPYPLARAKHKRVTIHDALNVFDIR